MTFIRLNSSSQLGKAPAISLLALFVGCAGNRADDSSADSIGGIVSGGTSASSSAQTSGGAPGARSSSTGGETSSSSPGAGADGSQTSTGDNAWKGTGGQSSQDGSGGTDDPVQTGEMSSGGVPANTSAGGSGSSETTVVPATTEASFATLVHAIDYSQPTCIAAPCHGGRGRSPNLTMDDGLYDRLLTTISEPCGNVPMITPGKPEESAFLMILKGPCGETARMPDGCFDTPEENNCMKQKYIDAIEQWILDGAPENPPRE